MIKKYKQFLNESVVDIDLIKELCNKYNIKRYTINDDGSIDVSSSVRLAEFDLVEIPLKFRNVSGDFDCYENSLTTLKGSPIYVDGDFDCFENKLVSLEGSPRRIGGDMNCSYNDIVTLDGSPDFIGGKLVCSDNKLTSIVGLNHNNTNLYVNRNRIVSLEGFENLKNFSIDSNPIFYIWWLFQDDVSKIELFNEYDIIRVQDGEPAIVLDRLNSFLEDIGEDPVEGIEGYINL